jgi:hypothetical protein
MTDSEKYKSFDDVKCLWMKCGAVDYKICDKDFECENCDFDKNMLSKLKIKGNIQEEIENMFSFGQHAVTFSHPYYHFCGGLMVRYFLADNYYLGIEPFIAKFIDKHSVVKYGTGYDIIKIGDPILKISNGWGVVDVLSPFGFNFVEKLDLSNFFVNNRHWFAVIETERHEILGSAINKKSYYDKLFETKLNLANLLKMSDNVGTTAYDGGTFLENWSDILGKNVYKALLEKLFS